jgi:NADH dehydrogenase (ubiquinone) 1 beta subcomplex subunit 11
VRILQSWHNQEGRSEESPIPKMSGMAGLRRIHKLMNRLSWTPVTKSHVNAKQSINRSISTTNVCKFNILPSNMNKVAEGNRKNWVSYGFSNENEYLDKCMMHLTFFVSVSICLTLGSYVLIYLPDFKMKDWALREAYLELRRRESQGLPPIDPNLIDPSKVILPSDEELQGTEIII